MERDSYLNLVNYLKKQKLVLYDWVFDEIGYFYNDKLTIKIVKNKWLNLQNSINSNNVLYIRNAGPNKEYLEIYKELGWNIKIDHCGNKQPKKTLGEITGYWINNQDFKYKEKYITGYTVSHIWGFTHNPLLFNCPWNICYIPSSMDPLTGHMTKSIIAKEEFKNRFLKSDYYKNFVKPFVKEYNLKYKELRDKVIENINKCNISTKSKQLLKNEWQELTNDNIFENF